MGWLREVVMCASRWTARPHCWSAASPAGVLIVTKRGCFTVGTASDGEDPQTWATEAFALVKLSHTCSHSTCPYVLAGSTRARQSANALPFGKVVSRLTGLRPRGAPPSIVM